MFLGNLFLFLKREKDPLLPEEETVHPRAISILHNVLLTPRSKGSRPLRLMQAHNI